MRFLFLILLVLTMAFTGCQVVSGSGDVVVENRTVSNFDSVTLSGIGDLTVIQGDVHSLRIEAEDNLLPYIETEVKQNVLTIGIQDGIAIQNREPIKFIVTAPDITELTLSGAGNMTADTILEDSLALNITGAGKMILDDVQVDTLDVQISGTGDVAVAGEAESQIVQITGAGIMNTASLKSADVEVHVSGTGEANVWATDTLDVEVTGAGSVTYQGTPSVNRSITGVGTVEQVAER